MQGQLVVLALYRRRAGQPVRGEQTPLSKQTARRRLPFPQTPDWFGESTGAEEPVARNNLQHEQPEALGFGLGLAVDKYQMGATHRYYKINVPIVQTFAARKPQNKAFVKLQLAVTAGFALGYNITEIWAAIPNPIAT